MAFIKMMFVVMLLNLGAAFGQEIRLDRFAFGGCNMQRLDQSFWANIAAVGPQLWVWNGDIIYADRLPLWLRQNEYQYLKNDPNYTLIRNNMPIIGTWDDHDYAWNNQGVDFPDKEASKELLLEFFDEAADSIRRMRPGIYAAYKFGPPASRVKIILLDERSFRQDPGANAQLLGEEQWSWLRDELTAGDARVIFLVSSSQVIPDEHGGDTLAQYPAERERLMNMLSWSEVPVVILSGDRHIAEITLGQLPNGRPIYEFTSSGLTHHSPYDSPNSRRVGPLYRGKNFGVVELNWDTWPLQVNLQIWDADGSFIHQEVVELEGSFH